MWNHGYGKLQCDRPKFGTLDTCKKHVTLPHGRVRGPIPLVKLDQFRAFALKQDTKVLEKKWYARYLMWEYASKVSSEIEYLKDLNDGQYEQCLALMNGYIDATKGREAKKYEAGRGVRMRDDRAGEGSESGIMVVVAGASSGGTHGRVSTIT